MSYLDFSGMLGRPIVPGRTMIVPAARVRASGVPLVSPPPGMDPAFDRRMPTVSVFQWTPWGPQSPPVGSAIERF